MTESLAHNATRRRARLKWIVSLCLLLLAGVGTAVAIRHRDELREKESRAADNDLLQEFVICGARVLSERAEPENMASQTAELFGLDALADGLRGKSVAYTIELPAEQLTAQAVEQMQDVQHLSEVVVYGAISNEVAELLKQLPDRVHVKVQSNIPFPSKLSTLPRP